MRKRKGGRIGRNDLWRLDLANSFQHNNEHHLRCRDRLLRQKLADHAVVVVGWELGRPMIVRMRMPVGCRAVLVAMPVMLVPMPGMLMDVSVMLMDVTGRNVAGCWR